MASPQASLARLRPRSRRRVYRHSASKGIGGLALAAIAILWVGIALINGWREALVIPFLFFPLSSGVFGTAYFFSFFLQRAVIDAEGLAVFNGLGQHVGQVKWNEIIRYGYDPTSRGRGAWHVDTVQGRFRIPTVEEPHRLQAEILARVRPNVLRWSGNRQALPHDPPMAEVHERRYLSPSDFSGLTASVVGLVASVIGVVFLALRILQGSEKYSEVEGFAIGMVIVLAIFLCRKMVYEIRMWIAGRKIDITQNGIVFQERDTVTHIRWKELRLVEKAFLGAYDKQANYFLLFDGKASIAYRCDWRHADLLIRYAVAEGGPDTVFAGFE